MSDTDSSIVNDVRDLTRAINPLVNIDNKMVAIVPPGYDVKDLSKMMDAPQRKTGTVDLLDTKSFCAVVNEVRGTIEKDDYGIRIYGFPSNSVFVALLNAGTPSAPGWGDYRARYACPLTEEWITWTTYNKKVRTQVEFAEFIERNLPDIYTPAGTALPSGADMLEIATSFRAKQSVNFASGQLLSNGQVEFTYQEEIKGSAGATGKISIPETFCIAIPVYEGGAPYQIMAKLRYRLKDGTLTMWYELVREHKVLEAAFKDVWATIEQETKLPILRGTPPQ